MRYLLFFTVVLYSFTACKNSRTEKAAATPKPIFCDYRIWGEEGRDEATLRLQYKEGGEEGEALTLEQPARVFFNGTEIKADSSRFTGAYYEITKPVSAFAGDQEIVFVDGEKKEHRERFALEPFVLAEEIPETVKYEPFQIRLQNFPETATPIRLVMVDTSLQSVGVNEELLARKGIIQITAQHLARLTPGPVTLEIFREEEKPLDEGLNVSGKFTMTYGLRREFNLAE